MSRPWPQLRRNKSSRVGDSNRHFYLITRRTAKHKKDLSVLLCIQDQSVTKHSTKLNRQQNESYCLTREKLLISGDVKSNPGPVAHGTCTHAVLRNPAIALLQARFAQKGVKTLECTSDGSCFFSSVAHQLYNDPSYHMNVHAAGVEYVRNNRQKQRTVKNLLDPLQSNCGCVVTLTYMVWCTYCASSYQCINCCNTYKWIHWGVGTTNCYQSYKRTTGNYCY